MSICHSLVRGKKLIHYPQVISFRNSIPTTYSDEFPLHVRTLKGGIYSPGLSIFLRYSLPPLSCTARLPYSLLIRPRIGTADSLIFVACTYNLYLLFSLITMAATSLLMPSSSSTSPASSSWIMNSAPSSFLSGCPR